MASLFITSSRASSKSQKELASFSKSIHVVHTELFLAWLRSDMLDLASALEMIPFLFSDEFIQKKQGEKQHAFLAYANQMLFVLSLLMSPKAEFPMSDSHRFKHLQEFLASSLLAGKETLGFITKAKNGQKLSELKDG